MSYEVKQCPVCKLEEQKISQVQNFGDAIIYDCSRCGRYSISRTAEIGISRNDYFPQLSGWLRERNLLGIEIPMLTSTFLEELLKTLPNYSPAEKQNKLLKAIAHLTKYPGYIVRLFSEFDCSLAWAENDKELHYYVNSLRDFSLISAPGGTPTYPDHEVRVSAKGWEYLESHKSDIASKTQAFVAMSFDPELKSIYDNAIEKAIKSTGYTPLRVDVKPHLDRIDAKIIAEIKNSRFMVADVTQQNVGVYYEAGFAYGLGVPVIWCVRHDELKNVHFDTRQYFHIVWTTEDELKEKLKDAILATIGKK